MKNRLNTLKQSFGVAAGLMAAITTAPAKALESAETFLDQYNIPPSTVTELSDTPVTIVRRTEEDIEAFDKILREAQTKDGTLTDEIRETLVQNARTKEMAFTLRNTKTLSQCYVFPPLNMSAKHHVAKLARLPENALKNLAISDEEAFITSMLHEIRHCDSENAALPYPLKEADADAYGTKKAADITNNPETINTMKYMRALGRSLVYVTNGTHRTALYLDSIQQERTLPDKEVIDRVWEETSRLAGNYFDYDGESMETPGLKIARACNKALTYVRTENLDPLVKRRLELAVEAAKYFMPGSLEESPFIETTTTAQKPMTVSP